MWRFRQQHIFDHTETINHDQSFHYVINLDITSSLEVFIVCFHQMYNYKIISFKKKNVIIIIILKYNYTLQKYFFDRIFYKNINIHVLIIFLVPLN